MDKFCMNWNGYDANIKESFRKLRDDQRLFDVTLVTDDGQHIQAHKIILSAGSHFFSDVFLKNNQTNMLIYLKGINSVQLKLLLNFIYHGEASVAQEELKGFLEIGKELLGNDFEGDVSCVRESEQEESIRYMNKTEEIYKNRDNIIEGNIICDTLEPATENIFADGKETITENIQTITNSDLDLQILEMIEKSDGV